MFNIGSQKVSFEEGSDTGTLLSSTMNDLAKSTSQLNVQPENGIMKQVSEGLLKLVEECVPVEGEDAQADQEHVEGETGEPAQE